METILTGVISVFKKGILLILHTLLIILRWIGKTLSVSWETKGLNLTGYIVRTSFLLGAFYYSSGLIFILILGIDFLLFWKMKSFVEANEVQHKSDLEQKDNQIRIEHSRAEKLRNNLKEYTNAQDSLKVLHDKQEEITAWEKRLKEKENLTTQQVNEMNSKVTRQKQQESEIRAEQERLKKWKQDLEQWRNDLEHRKEEILSNELKAMEAKVQEKAERIGKVMAKTMAKDMAIEIAFEMTKQKLQTILNVGGNVSHRDYDALDLIKEQERIKNMRKVEEELEHKNRASELNGIVHQAKEIFLSAKQERYDAKRAVDDVEKMFKDWFNKVEKDMLVMNTNIELKDMAVKMLIMEVEVKAERNLTEAEKTRLTDKYEAELTRIKDVTELNTRVSDLATKVAQDFMGVEKDFNKVAVEFKEVEMKFKDVGMNFKDVEMNFTKMGAQMDVLAASFSERFTRYDAEIKILVGTLDNTKRELQCTISEQRLWTEGQIMEAQKGISTVVDQIEKFKNQFDAHNNAVEQVLMTARQENWNAQRVNTETQSLITNFEKAKTLMEGQMETHLKEFAALNSSATADVMKLFYSIESKGKEIEMQVKEFEFAEFSRDQAYKTRKTILEQMEQKIAHKQEMLEKTQRFIDEKIGWQEEKEKLKKDWEEREGKLLEENAESKKWYEEKLTEERRKRIQQEAQHDKELTTAFYTEMSLKEDLLRTNSRADFFQDQMRFSKN